MEEDQVYDVYMTGWLECFDGINNSEKYEGIEKRAYGLGWTHYILGDDLSSIDKLSKEEILKMIYKTD